MITLGCWVREREGGGGGDGWCRKRASEEGEEKNGRVEIRNCVWCSNFQMPSTLSLSSSTSFPIFLPSFLRSFCTVICTNTHKIHKIIFYYKSQHIQRRAERERERIAGRKARLSYMWYQEGTKRVMEISIQIYIKILLRSFVKR